MSIIIYLYTYILYLYLYMGIDYGYALRFNLYKYKECHLFSGKTKLDCVSTNNILVESFEFLMEYFMTC